MIIINFSNGCSIRPNPTPRLFMAHISRLFERRANVITDDIIVAIEQLTGDVAKEKLKIILR